ncbi:MAG: tRNA epoxyqueuosine(34) reductase QueG [Anaerolineae bacterium]|nr:tRNA epoxyqueuosine(34) reductase QueG [Anaerolineae bacterium]
MAERNWTRTVEGLAREAGLDLVGIVPAQPARTFDRYEEWLAAGYHGEMAYMARTDAVEKRRDPARILPEARTVVAVGLNYHTVPLPPVLRDDPSRGIVASYAWGPDYHDVMLPRLHGLAEAIARATGRPVPYRAYVDTGPVLERDVAARAGLGFVGKNTNLIQPRLGSWFFLGELLLGMELEPLQEPAPAAGTCGRCTRCLDACPTGALVAPYTLDARRCISYLTIELKGPIPRELRPLMGNRIFGCDICQEVCPWNRRFARPTRKAAFRPDPELVAPRLLDLLALDDEGFRRRFAGSPVKRAKRRGLLRNVAVAAGNWGDPSAVPILAALLGDHEPMIRGHAAWALGRIATPAARRALEQRRPGEVEDWVRAEIEMALHAG